MFFVIHREGKCESSFYMELMHYFGKEGGFQFILEQTVGLIGKPAFNIDILFAYIDLICGPCYIYHRSFVVGVLTPFTQAVCTLLSNIHQDQVKALKLNKLEVAVAQIDCFMRRVYTAKTKGEQGIILKVGICLSLLRAEGLERRIQATRLLAEICRSVKLTQQIAYYQNLPQANDSEVLTKLLKVPEIVGEIFGKKSHIQLIQRSTEILKFIFIYSSLTPADFGTIWACCEKDEQSKIEVFKVLSDASNYLPRGLIGLIVENFKSVPNTSFRDEDMNLICELGWRFANPTLEAHKEILNIEWKVITGEIAGLSNEVYLKTMERFCDIVTTPTKIPSSIMLSFFQQAYTMLELVLYHNNA